ncbi:MULTISPECIES: STAS domain-containing protein [unclassified Streptomyces]|jgi:anti-anti-sigma factor|uniref:STAS domain-containing protein n=1 Tax=unclassified Streptomyces TaxID=2593676 RepID=UPI003CF5AC29
MTTPLTLRTGRRADGTPQLSVSGEIDMSNASALAEALGTGTGRLVVDLTAVEYLDSAGLSVLFAHAERLELIVTPLLEPVLAVSGLAELATVHGPGADGATEP